MTIRSRIRVLLLVPLLLSGLPRAAAACSVGWQPINAPEAFRRQRYAEALLREADVVVRARAIRVTAPAAQGALGSVLPQPSPLWPEGHVVFRVDEVVQGSLGDRHLYIAGVAVKRDEFNAGPVPYASPRRSALQGACFTYEYRIGADYLLVLKRLPVGTRELTPYWAALAPVNEQLRSTRDPWLVWVRRQQR